MSDSAQTHYVNVDFDLGLRPRPAWSERSQIVRQVRELSLQGLLGATVDDAVLVHADVPEELLEYFERNGLSVPRVLTHPQLDAASRFRPFGWSAEAIELNRRHDRVADHPPSAVIERVNSRSLALEFELDLVGQRVAGRVVAGLAELQAHLSDAPADSEWILKAEHGNSGLANRRLRRPQLAPADIRFVNGLFAQDDRLLVEPWLARERDWCVVFDVPHVGASLRIHETICTRDGALLGALFEPRGTPKGPYADRLAETAARVARSLAAIGYFGPACIDAFSWRDAHGVRLRELADLNCRLSMSDGAYRSWCQLAPQRTYYYRFFNRRKLKLPETLSGVVAALGECAYDRSLSRGILILSPPGFGKLAVAMIAESRPEVFALEAEFRTRFES